MQDLLFLLLVKPHLEVRLVDTVLDTGLVVFLQSLLVVCVDSHCFVVIHQGLHMLSSALGLLPGMLVLLDIKLNDIVGNFPLLRIPLLLLLLLYLCKIVKLFFVALLPVFAKLYLIIEVLLGQIVIVLDQRLPFTISIIYRVNYPKKIFTILRSRGVKQWRFSFISGT